MQEAVDCLLPAIAHTKTLALELIVPAKDSDLLLILLCELDPARNLSPTQSPFEQFQNHRTQGKSLIRPSKISLHTAGNKATLPSTTSTPCQPLAHSYSNTYSNIFLRHFWDQECLLPVTANLGCQLAWVWNQLNDKPLGTDCCKRFPCSPSLTREDLS